VVGSGFTLQAKTTDDTFNDAVEAKWMDWWTYGTPELRGYLSGCQLERHLRKSNRRDGDVGLVLLRDGGVQLIESDLIESPVELLKLQNLTIVDGVKVNGQGRPVGYYIRSSGDVARGFEYTEVNARDFVFYPRIATEHQFNTRGVSAFSTTFPMFDHLDGYVDATVIAARMAAIFGLVIKKMNPTGAFNNLQYSAANADGNQQAAMNLEPGMVHYLGLDEDITQVKSDHPSQSFPEFVATMLRLIGQPFSMPLEVLALDYSRTNYSSARAALEQFHRAARVEQREFANRVLSRIYKWRVSKWVNDGELPTPADENYWAHTFVAPGWPYLDPVKEIQAAMLAIDGGLSTATDELAKIGKDFDDVTRLRRRELDAMEELELPQVRSSLGRDVAEPMPVPAPPTAEDGDIDDEQSDPEE
jgi:lambda family phage portal protein